MIDWKRMCLELAEVVNRHRKDRMHKDMKLGWEMAQELIELGKNEDEAKNKFLEYWKCGNKEKARKIRAEYLESIS